MARVEVDTGIDFAQMDKDLVAVQRKIKSLQAKIEKDKIKLDFETKTMGDLGGQLDQAKAEYEELRAIASDPRQVLAMTSEEAATLPGRLADAANNVKVLQKEFDKSYDAVQKTEKSIALSETEVQQLTEREEELGEAIQQNTSDQVVFNKRAEDGLDRIGKRLSRLAKRVLFFSVFTMALRSLRSYITGIITSNDEAAESLGRLKGAFETLLAPLISAVIPVLVVIVNWITRIINAILTLISLLTGKTIAAMQNTAKSAKKTAGATGKAAKSLAAFDTVQKLSSGSSGGGGGGASSGIEPIYDLGVMAEDEMKKILAIVGLIGAAFLAWRISPNLAAGIKNFIGIAMIMAGLVIAIKNYLDAWNNGVNFDNLADMIAGILLLLGGMLIVLGPTAAGFAAIAAGVALVVLAFKDMSSNGVNLANTLTLLAVVLLTGIGLFAATGSAIFAVIGVIAAAVLAVMGFGGTLGKFVESVKGIFNGLITFFTGVFTGDWDKAWEGVKEIFKNVWNAILAIFGGVVNAIIRGLNWLIDKINTIEFTVPDWVPFIGGNNVGFNLSHVKEWEIPYLAQGAVIPPNRQFMAVLGDQKSGTNIEAPLDTMVQAFRQAGGGPQNINIKFTGSLSELARILKPEIDNEGFRLGPGIGANYGA